MIVLSYNGYVVTFKDPLNPERLSLINKNVFRRDMNQDFFIHRHQPIEYQQIINIPIYKCTDDEDDLINFLKQAKGKKIQYYDPYGSSWTVRILTNPVSIIDESRARRTARITLRGVLNG